MKTIQFITFLAILICLLIVIPTSFAVDNETVIAMGDDNQNITVPSDSSDILGDNEYYFDALIENDTGDGSQYSPFKELKASRIKSDSIIHLASGEYDFDDSKTIDNVIIIGENPQNTIIKNAKFTVSTSFTLLNVTLISSTITNDQTFQATNCIFKDSTSSMYGAAINTKGEVVLDNCTFINNVAECGGAIFANNGDLNINNSIFINNYAEMFGGAITAVNSDLILNNVTAKKNKAENYGGFIYTMYGGFQLYNSTFEDNSALNGSALFIDQVTYDIIEFNRFKNNTLYSLFNYNSTVENNTFSREDEFYETFNLNMFIGNSNYTLYNSPSINITEIPSKYDLRDYGYVTPVKKQGSNGNCWAFASMAALETSILKALDENFNLDLSESNVKNLFMKYGDYGWAIETNTGGYAAMGYNYLISWLGPVLDEDDPYNVNTLFSRVLNSIMHVQNVLFVQRTSLNETEEIKKIIMTYGAVFSQIHSSFSKGVQYYHTDTKANHAICVIGWDDDFEISGAPGKGAWIIKNSWGDTSPYGGYYYVSYYDTSCFPVNKTDGAYVFILNDTIKYDKNYQYDIQGKSDFFLNNTTTVGYKNIFQATDDEYLVAVSTIFNKITNYTFSIYVNNEFKLSQSGSSKPGYYTFNLDQFIPLTTGDTFEIVFNITVEGDAGVPISEKVSFNKCLYKENTSFISYDGINWVDLYNLTWAYSTHTYNSAVACIKAFTRLSTINTKIEIDFDNINDTYCDVIASVFNEWGFIVDTGVVTFNISDVFYSVNVTNGVAKLSNVSFEYGVNRIGAEFSGFGYNNSSNFASICIPVINTTMELSVLNNDNPVTIQAIIKDVENNTVSSGKVIFDVEGVNYTVDVVDGQAVLVHEFKELGYSNVSAVYQDLYCYNSSNGNISIYIPLTDTNISLTFSSNYNPVNITALVTNLHGDLVDSGNVTFTIDGESYTVDVVEGKAILTHIFESNADIFARYNGINGYNSSQCHSSLNISFIQTHLQLDVSSKVLNPVEITAHVYDEDGELVDSGVVIFNMDDESYDVTVNEGIAKMTHIFKNKGFYNISAEYVKNYKYDSSNNITDVNISKINVTLVALSCVRNYSSVTITVNVSDIINEPLYLLVNDMQYSTKIKDFEVTFTFYNLSKGNYTVKAFISSDIYESNELEGNFTILNYHTQLSVDNTRFYKGVNTFSATLKNIDGDLIENKEIEVTIGDRIYKNLTNQRGLALFSIDFNLDDKNLSVYYAGDEDYLNATLDVNITVNETVISEYSIKTYNSNYEFKLMDLDGNFLNNTKVTLKIGSDNYDLTTDGNGTVVFNVKLNPGNYALIISNPVTGEVKIQTIDVVKRITENKDMTMYYGAGKYYKVKVFDDDGNIAKGVTVTFIINNVKYTRTTDNNGYASFKISNNPGKYTISAEFKGFKVSNKITVKTTIITKNIKVKKGKTIKFTAKLLNKNGKILKKKKITFKFKGKKYRVKTNNKGKATLKITKKYRKGKYTITTIYGKLKVKNTIKIK